MGTTVVDMPDEYRPHYLEPDFNCRQQTTEWDLDLHLYLPSEGDHTVDELIIRQYEQYLVTEWGFQLVGIGRNSNVCGNEPMFRLTFHIKGSDRASARLSEQQLNTLRSVARVRYRHAGTADVESCILDGEIPTRKVTFTVSTGPLPIDVVTELNDGERRYVVKHSPVRGAQYTCFIEGAEDLQRSPADTIAWLAVELGLFLLKPIKPPVDTVFHREGARNQI